MYEPYQSNYHHLHITDEETIFLSHQKGWIPTICFDMVGTGWYYAEWSKSVGERQTLYGFTHMENIKNSERDYRGKERKWEKSERVTEHERLLTLGNKQELVRGDGQGDGVIGWWALRGHLTGWAMGVILYVGKLNSNKNILKIISIY